MLLLDMSNYSYQDNVADKIVKLLNDEKPTVLAATPGSGKSAILTIVLNNIHTKYSNILILTHNMNILKDQMVENFSSGNVIPTFLFGEKDAECKVTITLPNKNLIGYDFLVVDEAHEYYFADTIQSLINNNDFKGQLLLTGSPSKFNRLKNNFSILHISVEDLQRYEVFSTIEADVLRESSKDSSVIIENMIKKNKDKDLSKILVACSSIEEAKIVSQKLICMGRKVAFSTSENDKSSTQIKDFKKGIFDCLVIVNRGILGFSDSNITALFDLKKSKNLDKRNQLIARILRRHPTVKEKTYMSYGDNDFNEEVFTLHKVCALMNRDTFVNYTDKCKWKISKA